MPWPTRSTPCGAARAVTVGGSIMRRRLHFALLRAVAPARHLQIRRALDRPAQRATARFPAPTAHRQFPQDWGRLLSVGMSPLRQVLPSHAAHPMRLTLIVRSIRAHALRLALIPRSSHPRMLFPSRLLAGMSPPRSVHGLCMRDLTHAASTSRQLNQATSTALLWASAHGLLTQALRSTRLMPMTFSSMLTTSGRANE